MGAVTSVEAGQEANRVFTFNARADPGIGVERDGSNTCLSNRFRKYRQMRRGSGRRWGPVERPIQIYFSIPKMSVGWRACAATAA